MKVSQLFNHELPSSPTMTEATSLEIFVFSKPSSEILLINSDQPFSITLSAYVVGTYGQPLTVYAPDTILHPRAPALERNGLVFTDTATGQTVERPLVDALREYPRGGCRVATVAKDSFIEIPANPKTPYEVTFTFVPSAAQALGEFFPVIDPRAGFLAGHVYKVGLGEAMAGVIWWKVGAKGKVLAEGERSGERVKLDQPDTPRLRMVSANESMFGVRDGYDFVPCSVTGEGVL